MRRNLLVGLALAMVLNACEDPFIDPFVPGKHYTVYGYLNALDLNHAVRIVPVRRSPESIPTPSSPQAQIDAVVTSVDLSTNEPVRWTHTLQRLDDGTYGHVFTSRFVVREGHRYRLTIQRSDGVETTAETTVPNLGPPEVQPAQITADSVVQVVDWVGAGVPDGIEVAYCAKPVGGFSCRNVTIDYGRAGRKVSDGWEVPVVLSHDLRYVRQQLAYPDSVTLELLSLDMRFTSLDADWQAPVGPFDPQLFGQPDALTNVENGFGFWGSVARANHAWIPDAAALARLGYLPPS